MSGEDAATRGDARWAIMDPAVSDPASVSLGDDLQGNALPERALS
jgi:hypothetical protein